MIVRSLLRCTRLGIPHIRQYAPDAEFFVRLASCTLCCLGGLSKQFLPLRSVLKSGTGTFAENAGESEDEDCDAADCRRKIGDALGGKDTLHAPELRKNDGKRHE